MPWTSASRSGAILSIEWHDMQVRIGGRCRVPHSVQVLASKANFQPTLRSDGGAAGRSGSGRRGGSVRTMPRQFRNAPKLFNAKRFKHPDQSGDGLVTQVGAPGWFDDTLRPMRAKMRRAAERALRHRAERVSRKAP